MRTAARVCMLLVVASLAVAALPAADALNTICIDENGNPHYCATMMASALKACIGSKGLARFECIP